MDEQLRNLVNTSGFPLQLRLEQEVRSGDAQGKWEILSRELPWEDEAGAARFIDMVLGYRYAPATRLVVEAKRRNDGRWVFLRSATDGFETTARGAWFGRKKENPAGGRHVNMTGGYKDLEVEPKTPESEFCIVGCKKGKKGGPMLEAVAGECVVAAEALAVQEAVLDDPPASDGAIVYVPVIVTNVELFVCDLDPRQVDLATGGIDDSAVFTAVDVVRFRKTLSAGDLALVRGEMLEFDPSESLAKHVEGKVRTVFVVRASAFAKFLGDWHWPGDYEDFLAKF